MVYILMPFDKHKKAHKDRAYDRIMWLFKKYQKTGDKEQYLGEIQNIVNQIDQSFYIEFKNDNKPYKIMFVPDHKKGLPNFAEKMQN